MPKGSYDPLWLRIVLAGLFAGLFGLSFVSEIVRRRVIHVSHMALFIATGWVALLVYGNALHSTYAMSYLSMLLFVGMNMKNGRTALGYAIVNLVFAATTIFFIREPAVSPAAFLPLTALMLLISLMGLGFRISIQRELRRNRDLLGSILDNSPDARMIAHRDTCQIIECNHQANQMFGSEGQLEALNAHLPTLLKEIRGEALPNQPISIRREVRLTRLDGTEFWAEILVSEIQAGRHKRLLINIADISARINAEQTIKLSDYILHEVEHLVVVADIEGRVIYISPSVERVLGYPSANLMGDGWWTLHSGWPEERESERSYVIEAASKRRKPRIDPYEREYITALGKKCWIQWKDSVTDDNLLIAVGIENTNERHGALIRSVIFNIAEASSKVRNPNEFYQFIHQEIRRVIDTPNFYIAEYDQVSDLVYFPYYADAADTRQPFSRKAGKGLTELTISRKRPLLASKQEIQELEDKGLIALKGQTIPEVWLGVPLLHNQNVVGLITIQDYERPDTYTADDLSLLNFIASQVAQFVSKLQADQALRLSEERFRAIYDQAAVGIAQISTRGMFLQVNHRLSEIFGYSAAELQGMSPLDITFPADKEIGQKELEAIRSGVLDSYTIEKRYLHREGHVIHARVNVSVYREQDKVEFIISIYEDITERIRAQEETALLLSLSMALNVATSEEEALLLTMDTLRRQSQWDYAEAWIVRPEHQFILAGTSQPEGEIPLATAHSGIGFDPQGDLSLRWWQYITDAREFGRMVTFEHAGFQTLVRLPVQADNKLVAVILLASKRMRMEQERKRRLLTAAVAQLLTHMLRKEAEQAQRESEARYRAITEAAFEGIAIHRDGVILEVNTAFANLFGYHADELSGMALQELIYEESPDKWLSMIEAGEGAVAFSGCKKDTTSMFLEAVSRPGVWEGSRAGILAVRDITNEKLMEESREAARIDARFRAYVQNSSEIIQIVDVNGIVQYTSPSLEKVTGLDPESVLGGQFTDLVHPGDNPALQQLLQRIQATPGHSERMELRVATEDGDWRYFQAAFTNLLEDQLVKGILFSAHDITDIKRVEAALLENETKFRSIFSQANDAILVIEALSIIECNDMAIEMYGLPREQVIGATLYDLSPPTQPDGNESRQKIIGKLGDALDGTNQYFTWKHQRSGGELFDAEISLTQIRIGEKLYVQCVVRDITERIKAESALRESERRNKAILDAVPDLMLRINSSGHVLDYKAADDKALLDEDMAVPGCNIRDLLPPLIAGMVMEKTDIALETGDGQQFETELMFGGKTHDYETRLVRSGPREALVIIRDVTERKRTEKELIKRNFELDSFVYRASHDLKAPLNSLMGLISIMGTEVEDIAVQGYLKMMNKSVVKLDTFIRDLADFSRNARIEVETSVVNWSAIVTETLENLQYMDNAERVQRIVEIKEDGPFYSDPVRIGIVLNNIVSNAIKYQNLQQEGAWVKIRVDSGKDHCTIHIEDNGIGIAEEHLNKVFNLFFRASVQSYGSGMGMYIVKNAVERLHGDISLHSALGEGTTFTVVVPNQVPEPVK